MIRHRRCRVPITLAAVANDPDALLDELLRFWRSSTTRFPPGSAGPLLDYQAAVLATRRTTQAAGLGAELGAELGEQLIAEVLQGVRAGRRGVFVSEPERLRTAIFLRGYTLGRFARFAGITPSTLSRAVTGQPVAPSSWQALITALVHAYRPGALARGAERG